MIMKHREDQSNSEEEETPRQTKNKEEVKAFHSKMLTADDFSFHQYNKELLDSVQKTSFSHRLHLITNSSDMSASAEEVKMVFDAQ